MPLFDIECPNCGEVVDVWAKIDEIPICPKCKAEGRKLIGATNINPDWKPYIEHNMGHDPVLIKSRQHYYEERNKRGLASRSDTR